MTTAAKSMKAYVLIETAPGKTKSVKKELTGLAGGQSTVIALDALTGPFDFIAVVAGEALVDALDGRGGHAVFVATGRVHDHALPIPYHEDTPRSLYWGEYAKNKIEGEDACLRRHRECGLPVTIVRPTHVYGPLNTRNNETFFFDRLVRGRPVLVPGAGGRRR